MTDTPTDTKKWYASKTVWFNLAMGVIQLFATAIGHPIVDPQTGVAIQTIGNILLRTVTTKPVA